MNITICDDNIYDLTKLEILLEKYKELHSNIDFEMEQFLNPSILYKKTNLRISIYSIFLCLKLRGLSFDNNFTANIDNTIYWNIYF